MQVLAGVIRENFGCGGCGGTVTAYNATPEEKAALVDSMKRQREESKFMCNVDEFRAAVIESLSLHGFPANEAEQQQRFENAWKFVGAANDFLEAKLAEFRTPVQKPPFDPDTTPKLFEDPAPVTPAAA